MPAHRKISDRQVEILVSYMEQHKEFASGRINPEGGPLGKHKVEQEWDRLAKRLNDCGKGIKKSSKEWRIYWNSLKYKVKMKVAEKMKKIIDEGGVPSWKQGDLKDDVWRIMCILGKESIIADEKDFEENNGESSSSITAETKSCSREISSVRMPAQGKTSAQQMEMLVSYMEEHNDFAKGRLNQEGGPLAKHEVDQEWDQLAQRPNSCGNGIKKSSKGWRSYWNNIKCSVRARVTERMKQIVSEGGVPSWEQGDFKDETWRIMCILGKDNIFGDDKVQIPFPEADDINADSSSSTSSSRSNPSATIWVPGPRNTRSASAASPRAFSSPLLQPTHSHFKNERTSSPLTPDMPDWVRTIEERNLETQERIARTLEEILNVQKQILGVLNEKLPHL